MQVVVAKVGPNMMASHRRLFLFGAGASNGARNPSPPLGSQLHSYVSDYLCQSRSELGILEEPNDCTRTEDVRCELKQHLSDAVSYESLASKLLGAGQNDLLKKLNLLMAYTLTPPINDDPKVDDAFIEQRDIYDDFLTIKFRDSEELKTTSFITLNYDCLLERAICRSLFKGPQHEEMQCLCKHVNYHLTDNGSGIEVLKPHGSINWVRDTSDDDKPIIGKSIPLEVWVEPDGVLSWAHVTSVQSPHGHEDIVMAHYVRGKKAQANTGLLEKIRERALARVQEASSVIIIGVHIPNDSFDDPFPHQLLMSMKGCQVDYVSPDAGDIQRASSRHGFKTFQCGFDQYVKEMKGC